MGLEIGRRRAGRKHPELRIPRNPVDNNIYQDEHTRTFARIVSVAAFVLCRPPCFAFLFCSLPCSNPGRLGRFWGRVGRTRLAIGFGGSHHRLGRVLGSTLFHPRPMSSNNFRDSTVVIIETGRTTVRAGQGLHDLLRLPTVVCRLHFAQTSATGLRLALRRTSLPELASDDLLFLLMAKFVRFVFPILLQ